jgi:hypothetical protein
VVGTEGGIYPFRDGMFQPDNRYPPYNERSQAEATIAMFNWSATHAQPWFFGVTLWKEDDYYVPGPVHCMNRLGEVAPVYKDVPAIDVVSGGGTPPATPIPIGPGPIHGEADFHMIILGPGLETRWFFDTAQAYWNRFRPIVTTHDELIELIPSSKSLAVTALSTPEMADLMRQQIAERYVNVYFDLIVVESLQQVSDTLNVPHVLRFPTFQRADTFTNCRGYRSIRSNVRIEISVLSVREAHQSSLACSHRTSAKIDCGESTTHRGGVP